MKDALPSSVLLVFKPSFVIFCRTVMVLCYVTITLSMLLLSMATLLFRVTLIFDSFNRYNLTMFECMAATPMISPCSSVIKTLSIVVTPKTWPLSHPSCIANTIVADVFVATVIILIDTWLQVVVLMPSLLFSNELLASMLWSSSLTPTIHLILVDYAWHAMMSFHMKVFSPRPTT